jgi:hypothetical protein
MDLAGGRRGFAGVGVTLGMWWTYFTMPSAEVLHIFRSAKAFAWGYGHLPVFMSIAATGAGLHVAADYLKQTAGERPMKEQRARSTSMPSPPFWRWCCRRRSTSSGCS